MTPVGIACLVLFLAGSAHAEWRDHPELPGWCRRGEVRWVHGFTTMNVARVDMLLDLRQNLKQSGRFADEAAAARARAGGLRFQPYLCSKTIFWKRVFKTHPELKAACCVDPAGKRRLMYGNPERYAGCYRSGLWRAYIEERLDQTVQSSHPDSIFFDNFACYDCYGPVCRKEFPGFTKSLLGRALTLGESQTDPSFAFAKLMFDSQAALDFFREMRRHLRETSTTPVVISPNCHVGVNWQTYLTSLGVNDLVFYEQGRSFPPFTRQVYGYKLGLAASHGKVVGQLLGLPAAVAEARALKWGKDWQFHRPEVQESYTYPEEYQLAIAEGAACDGTFIPSTHIREQKIRPTDEPHQVAVRKGMKKYYDFLAAHEDLYANALPGASTAVVYSLWTNLHNRKAQELPRVTADLLRAGVPFEIITEDDLTGKLLAPYHRLLLVNVENLSREDGETVERFARAGNTVLVAGACGIADRLGVAFPEPKWAAPARRRVRTERVGRGKIVRVTRWPADFSGDDVRRWLESLVGPFPVAVPPAETRVMNLLRTHEGHRLEVHLLNYDFRYERPQQNEAADDDGSGEARTYLADVHWRARKLLRVRDTARFSQPVLRFFGNAPGTDFQLVVSLNGRDLKSFPGSALRTHSWHEVPVGGGLKQGTNVVEFRVTGNPNSNRDYFNLRIDTDARTRRSLWSTDGGKRFSPADLSPDRGPQTGEYLVRLIDKKTYKVTFTPKDFAGKLKVVPARNIPVALPASYAGWHAACLSPDHAPVNLPVGPPRGGQVIVRVPSVRVYEVLVLTPP